MFDVLTFFRFFVAGIAGALVAYFLCWSLLAKVAGFRPLEVWSGSLGRELRRGRAGFLRLYVSYVVAFATYGLIATYDAEPFTYAWIYCAVLDGDWVVILVAPLFFTFLTQRFSNRPDRRAIHAP